jgi:hypothetical protein
MLMPCGVERAIEIANHNGWRENGELIVWDCLSTPSGTKLVVYPAASAVGGFCATMRDRCGHGVALGSYPTEADAARAALDQYLTIVNVGV